MALKQCSSILPTIFLPHGGGPMPLLNPDELSAAVGSVLQPGKLLSEEHINSISTVLFVSAHWEEAQPTITSSPNPGLYFDYYGFPEEAYEYQWKAPGQPAVAERIASLLSSAGFEPKLDDERDFDHGVFVPGLLMAPEPTIPVVQLSLLQNLNPSQHIAMGQALQPLREEGVLIIGSGLSYHNMRGFFGQIPNAIKDSIEFDDYLNHACVEASPEERLTLLSKWTSAPHARDVHPREEHLIPLHVVAGAAPHAKGRRFFSNQFKTNGKSGVRHSGWIFED
jgi:aromatic ring-opening dioxygenase catalytic subunit (LigB family)